MTTLENSQAEIIRSIRSGAAHYFDSCRKRIPDFVDTHFRHPGAIKTNRVAFGWDLLRAPLNLFWAPIYALICILRFALRRKHSKSWLARALKKTPAGFTTKVQGNISALIGQDLLEPHPDQSLDAYINISLCNLYQNKYRNKNIPGELTDQLKNKLAPLLKESLLQYQVTRTASADISNTLSCTILGTFAFKKFTPGGIGVGLVSASLIAEKIAVSNFVFGETLGNIYYGMFPPQASLPLVSASLLGVMVCLSVVAAFSGVITDPIQVRMGLHQKRLNKMLDALEKDFIENTQNSFRPKDQFIARILDAFDMLKASLL